MITRIIIVLVIIGIIIGAFILGQGGPAPVATTGTSEAAGVPGYSARNAEVTQTGDDGRTEFTIISPLIRQLANDDRVQLDSPRLTFASEENGLWHAQAISGLIHDNGKLVELHGDVKINGTLSESPVAIATSTLSYDTGTEIASTPAQVVVDARGGTSSGRGLVTNLKESTLRLESNVQLESPIHGSSPSK